MAIGVMIQKTIVIYRFFEPMAVKASLEKDMVKKSETKRIAASVLDASLQILPGETHASYVVKSPKLFPLLDEFFSAHCY